MNFRSKVLKIAHNLVKTLGWSLSEALKQSWKAYRLRKMMHSGSVDFTFKKVSGEMREAHGTLNNIEHLLSGSDKFSSEILHISIIAVKAPGFPSANFIKQVFKSSFNDILQE